MVVESCRCYAMTNIRSCKRSSHYTCLLPSHEFLLTEREGPQQFLRYTIRRHRSHQLGIYRHVSSPSNSSSKDFQVVFVHLVYNSALLLASWCSFLLHVVDNLIRIFLDSRQLVLLFQNFFVPFMWSKTVRRLFF